MTDHHYEIAVEWTGNRGEGTSTYRGYGRSHVVSADGLPEIEATADPAFLGSTEAWNPEQLFLAALSQCHLLTYLALCARHGVSVTAYVDQPVGTMASEPTGGGRFTDVLLRPQVTVAAADQAQRARDLHEQAHRLCFIAQSVSCPVRHEPEIVTPSA
jgi:organic hydroperoxide reductase OsmC/OhrA